MKKQKETNTWADVKSNVAFDNGFIFTISTIGRVHSHHVKIEIETDRGEEKTKENKNVLSRGWAHVKPY